MSNQDYYSTLGISKDADASQIKKAYRKLAHKYHPDRNSDSNAEDKFKEVSEAHEVLSDPQKKQNYDNYGDPKAAAGSSMGADPFDIFNVFFGGGQRRQRKGRDLRIRISISLEEVFNGVTRDLSYGRNIQCKDCDGRGGSGSTCKTCSGYGQVSQQSGFSRTVRTCPACRGSKVTITKKCASCKGNGQTENAHSVSVKIPPGIETGQNIRVAGGGDISDFKIAPGDLMCQIMVNPHPVFERNRKDILCVQDITFAEACLGTSVSVPTIEGKNKDLKIPAGTPFGKAFRLKKQGLPQVNRNKKSRGDQYVKINIVVPTDLKQNEKDLLKRFDKKIKDRA